MFIGMVPALLIFGFAQTVSPADAIRQKMAAGLAMQRQAVSHQRVSRPAADLVESVASAVSTEPCDPLAPETIEPLIDENARRNGLSPDLLRAIIRRESAGRPCAVSPKGAMGLMQLMPLTARDLGVSNPFEPAQNIAAGSRMLKDLLTRYDGDLSLALAAYNAGPGAVDRYRGVPPYDETREYLRKILGSGVSLLASPDEP